MAFNQQSPTLTDNILIVYNPNSGRGRGAKFAQKLGSGFLKRGIRARTFESARVEDIYSFCKDNYGNPKCYSLAIIIGGDGTLSTCVDAMLKNNFDVAVYAFGRGTANDFSTYMKTNKSIRRVIKIILASPPVRPIDTLYVRHQHYSEGSYAINVACGGAFTNGVTNYNSRAKAVFGKVAYMTKASGIAMRMRPQQVKFTVDGKELNQQEIYLFLILNTTHAGSVKYISPMARPWDQQLNLVAIKKCGFFAKIGIMLSVLSRRAHKNKNILQAKGKTISVEVVGDAGPNFTRTDIDGNAGDSYPLHVKVGDKRLQVVVNHTKTEGK